MSLLNHLFFTELLGLRVYDLKGRELGRIRDAALVPLVDAIRVDRFLLGGGPAWLTVRYDQVGRINLDGLWLRDELLTPYHRDEYMLRIGRDLLDQQIIDVDGRKVVRVSDVTFNLDNSLGYDELRIVEVDIGLRSMFRRVTQGLLPRPLIRRMMMPIPPNSINWQVCNIVESDPQRRLHLNISHDRLEHLHPADLADIVEALGPEDREAIFESIDSEVAAEALSEISPEIQSSILESLDEEKAADIIEEMSPDEAADVLGDLDQDTYEAILEEMENEPKAEVRELLEHREDSAGRLMSTEYVTLPTDATVADAIAAIAANVEIIDSLNTLFLIDAEEKLTGAVPLARLFTVAGSERLDSLQAERLLSVPVTEKQDRITELFDKYNLLTLPVLDKRKRLVGVIHADDIIALLRSL